MVLHPEKEIGGSYALRMLSENRINGLLPFQEKRIDGETFLYFNITSRQSFIFFKASCCRRKVSGWISARSI